MVFSHNIKARYNDSSKLFSHLYYFSFPHLNFKTPDHNIKGMTYNKYGKLR